MLITVLPMEFLQKLNSPGPNNCLGSDIYEIINKRVGLLLNKVYLIKVPLWKKKI